MKATFRPLGYNKPAGVTGRQPEFVHHVKAGKRNDSFKSEAFVIDDSIFFRCNYTLENTGTTTDGKINHWWRVRNAWFVLECFKSTSISEATELAAPYFPPPYNSDMMTKILRNRGIKYWPNSVLRAPRKAQPSPKKYAQSTFNF